MLDRNLLQGRECNPHMVKTASTFHNSPQHFNVCSLHLHQQITFLSCFMLLALIFQLCFALAILYHTLWQLKVRCHAGNPCPTSANWAVINQSRTKEPEVATFLLFPSPPTKQLYVFITSVDIFSPRKGRQDRKRGWLRIIATQLN